jgi:UDP-3-O-[3-hydroxymyristoyl] glucosamine N-acyltransferase
MHRVELANPLRLPTYLVTGSPAHDYTSTLRSQAVFPQPHPELEKRITLLENMIKELRAEKEN